MIEADDHRLAASLAEAAGRILTAVRDAQVLQGRALGAAGDAVAHQFLVRALAEQRPDDRVLSEEATGVTGTGRRGGRVWIIDPLDGTREYSEGRADWAVHVALVSQGEVIAAAVAMPDRDSLHSTGDTPSPSSSPGDRDASGDLRIAVSRSRPPASIDLIARRLGATLVPMGSAGAKVMAVVRGEVDAYVHAGGQYEWDSAAPVGVSLAAGLHASRIDGSPLVYDRPESYLPDLIVCRTIDAERIIHACVSEHIG